MLDELHVVVVPVLLGAANASSGGLDTLPERYECVEFEGSERAGHVVLRRTDRRR